MYGCMDGWIDGWCGITVMCVNVNELCNVSCTIVVKYTSCITCIYSGCNCLMGVF